MKNPRSLVPSILAVLVVGVLVSCGGGGGGGSAGPRLAGTLTIPDLGIGEGVPLGEREDDDAFHAARMGPVGTARRLAGTIGGDDPLDVRRFACEPGALRIALTAPRDVAAWIFEPATGRQIGRTEPGRPLVLDLATALELDVAIAGANISQTWRLDLEQLSQRSADIAAIAVPIASDAPQTRSPVQARWIGATHPMEAGEVAVLQHVAAPSLRPAGFDAAAVDLEPVQVREGDPLGVYRVSAAKTVATTREGAAIEWSLEMETCLAALRAARVAGVRAASPNYLRFTQSVEPNDPHYPKQWHYAQLRMDQAWGITTGDSGIVVGVIDTGIVSSHPDFAGRLVQGYDFISSATRARDGDGIDPNPEDEGDQSQPPNSSWHGTHVAGTIGASTDNGIGVAGMDWNCKVMPLRALGVGGGTSTDIMQAVRYAAGLANSSGTTPQGAQIPKGRCDVVNMSLGGGGASTVEQQLYTDVRNAGVLVVCAAGNENTSTPGYPAAYADNLSVGAVRFDKTRAPYSNFGSTIDVVAPGGDLTRDQNGDGYGDGVLSCLVDANRSPIYAFENGTSMAAPHVAGLASLLLAASPTLTVSALRNLITQNVEDLGAPGRDDQFGEGLIDPVAALRAATNSTPVTALLRVDPSGVNFGATSTTQTVNLFNDGNGVLVIDVPGSTVSYAQGQPTGWLSGTFFTAAGAISHDRLDLVVDRGLLPVGDYSAAITVATQNATSKTITVSMAVGNSGSNDVVYVLLVDGTTLDTIFQTETTAAQNWAFDMLSTSQLVIPIGDFLLVAGTDRDNDDLIGDDGEIFGIWPNSDSPQPVVVDSASVNRSDLDFALEPVQQISSTIGTPRAFHLLR